MSDRARHRPAPLVVVLFGAALGVLIGMVWAVAIPTGYRATATVSVRSTPAILLDGRTDPSFVQQARDSYASVATSPYVLGAVIGELGLGGSVGGLASRTVVEEPAGTDLLDITVTDTSRSGATAVADAVARRLEVAATALSPTISGAAPSVRLRLVRSAVMPAPSSARLSTVLAGLLVGVAVGVVVLLIASLRRRPPSRGLLVPAAP